MTPTSFTAPKIATPVEPAVLVWLRRLLRLLPPRAKIDARTLSRHMRRDIGLED